MALPQAFRRVPLLGLAVCLACPMSVREPAAGRGASRRPAERHPVERASDGRDAGTSPPPDTVPAPPDAGTPPRDIVLPTPDAPSDDAGPDRSPAEGPAADASGASEGPRDVGVGEARDAATVPENAAPDDAGSPPREAGAEPTRSSERLRDGLRFVLVPAGTFEMGSPADEPGRSPWETRHRVTLTRAFEIMVTEATQGEFERIAGYNPSFRPECGAACAADGLRWYDAAWFANRLSERAGLARCYDCEGEGESLSCSGSSRHRSVQACEGYRLPTEAEWEYAARAGTDTAFYNGPITHAASIEDEGCGRDRGLDAIGWYCHNADDAPRPVGLLAPNAWGLHDMLGNLGEWTHDADGEYGDLPPADPVATSGFNRILRGGGWYRAARDCRSAARRAVPPYIGSDFNGVRLVRTIDDPSAW